MAGVVGADADVVGGAGLCCWSGCDLSAGSCCCCCCCWALRIGDDGGGVEGLEEALLMHAPSSTAAAADAAAAASAAASASAPAFDGRMMPWSGLGSSKDGNASVRTSSTLGTFAASRCPGDSFSFWPRPLLSPPSRLNSLLNMLSEIAFLGGRSAGRGGLSCLGWIRPAGVGALKRSLIDKWLVPL